MPLNSVELTNSLKSFKVFLLDLRQQIENRNKINKLAGYSFNQREQEFAYELIFADPKYFSLMGNEYSDFKNPEIILSSWLCFIIRAVFYRSALSLEYVHP